MVLFSAAIFYSSNHWIIKNCCYSQPILETWDLIFCGINSVLSLYLQSGFPHFSRSILELDFPPNFLLTKTNNLHQAETYLLTSWISVILRNTLEYSIDHFHASQNCLTSRSGERKGLLLGNSKWDYTSFLLLSLLHRSLHIPREIVSGDEPSSRNRLDRLW